MARPFRAAWQEMSSLGEHGEAFTARSFAEPVIQREEALAARLFLAPGKGRRELQRVPRPEGMYRQQPASPPSDVVAWGHRVDVLDKCSQTAERGGQNGFSDRRFAMTAVDCR